MNILNEVSLQLVAELLAHAILLMLPLVALFLAAHSRRIARAALKLHLVPSPDRRRVAVEAQRNGDSEVYVGELNDGGAVNVTHHPDRDIGPIWSPDSTRLAWATDRHGNLEVYVADLTTGHVIRLTCTPEDERPLSWTAQGLEVLVTADGEATVRRLAVPAQEAPIEPEGDATEG